MHNTPFSTIFKYKYYTLKLLNFLIWSEQSHTKNLIAIGKGQQIEGRWQQCSYKSSGLLPKNPSPGIVPWSTS